ncbi:MAG: hypothetical protein ACOYLB_12130 [Phototrophicaceae bacterium]
MRDRLRQSLNIIFGILQLLTNAIGGAGLFGFPEVGSVSDNFYTYLIPAGYTFAVWAPIYIGLTVYMIYQALPNQKERLIHRRIGWIAAWVALGNAVWTPLFISGGTSPTFVVLIPSLVVIALMLTGLAMIFVRLREMDNALTVADRWCVQIPFSGYYAWVTVATVINTVTMLMTLGNTNDLLGIGGAMWSAILQMVAMLIAVSMIAYSRGNHGMVAYALVAIWAFVGVYNGNMPRAQIAGISALIVVSIITLFALGRITLRMRLRSATQFAGA